MTNYDTDTVDYGVYIAVSSQQIFDKKQLHHGDMCGYTSESMLGFHLMGLHLSYPNESLGSPWTLIVSVQDRDIP